jgi:hypothetical protein
MDTTGVVLIGESRLMCGPFGLAEANLFVTFAPGAVKRQFLRLRNYDPRLSLLFRACSNAGLFNSRGLIMLTIDLVLVRVLCRHAKDYGKPVTVFTSYGGYIASSKYSV